MLDMLIAFAEGVESDEISINLSKSQDAVHLRAGKGPGVVFNITSLRSSNGGVLNDITAQNLLNDQLYQQNGRRRNATKAGGRAA